MLDKNKGLIDYGKDVLHYPKVKINPFEIRMLLKENGYSVQRLEDHRTGEYRMIPDDARPVIVKLDLL